MTSFYSDAFAALNAPFNLAGTTISAAKESVIAVVTSMYFVAVLATSIAVIAASMA